MLIICLPLVYIQCSHFSQLYLWHPSPCFSLIFCSVNCMQLPHLVYKF